MNSKGILSNSISKKQQVIKKMQLMRQKINNSSWSIPTIPADVKKKEEDTLKLKKKNQNEKISLQSLSEPLLKFNLAHLNNDKQVTRNKEYPSPQLQDDLEVVSHAIIKNGLFLKNASPRLKNTPELVKLAVQNNGLALEFASPELQNNPEIIKISLQQNNKAEDFVSNEYKLLIYKQEKLRLIKTLGEDGTLLRFASYKMRNDPEVVQAAVMQNGLALEYATNLVKKDRQTVLKAVNQYSGAFVFADRKLQNDSEIQKIAVLNDPKHLNNSTPIFDIYKRPSNYPTPFDIKRPTLY
jgi:NAD kinase